MQVIIIIRVNVKARVSFKRIEVIYDVFNGHEFQWLICGHVSIDKT